MPSAASEKLWQYLRRVLAAGPEYGTADGALLEAFCTRRDQSAFAHLIERHGPLVYGVCRRVLQHDADAEDAFQTTFLVLSSRATTIDPRRPLANWLYTVARHTALKAKARRKRQERLDQKMTPRMTTESPPAQPELREVRELLDVELSALSGADRALLLMCDVQGVPHRRVAEELRLPIGSLSYRLGRARDRLRLRLLRRGLAVSAVALTTTLAQEGLARVPEALVANAVRIASADTVTAAVGPSIWELFHGVTRDMIMAKYKLAAVLVLSLGLFVSAGAGLMYSLQASEASQRAAVEADVFANHDGLSERQDASGDPLPPGAVARLGTLRWRHSDAVGFLAYLAEDKEMVTWSADGVVRTWDVASGKELRRLGTFTGLTVSADRKTLATRDAEGTISVCDAVSGTVKSSWKAERTDGPIVLSQDGTLLATKSYNHESITLYDAMAGKELRTLGQDDPGKVKESMKVTDIRRLKFLGYQSMAFTPDGKSIYSATGDLGPVHIQRYDVHSGKLADTITSGPFNGTVRGPILAPDGKSAVCFCEDVNQLYVWEVGKEKGRLVKAPAYPYSTVGPPRALAFSANQMIAVATDSGPPQAWDMAAGQELRPLDRIDKALDAISLAFSSDGKRLATGTQGNTVRQWEVASGEELAPMGGHQEPVLTVGASPDGKIIITRTGNTLGTGNTVHVWSLADGKHLRKFPLPGKVTHLSLAADGKTMAQADGEGVIRIWDVLAGKEVADFRVSGLNGLALTPNGTVIATRSAKGMRLHDASNGRVIRVLDAPPTANPEAEGSGYGPPVFSPDGSALAGLSFDRQRIHLWQAASGKLLGTVRLTRGVSHKTFTAEDTITMAFSPDGRELATGNDDNTVTVWELATGKERRTFNAPARVLIYTPDGRSLIAAGTDRVIRLIDANSGQERTQLRGHEGRVLCLTVTADGKTLVSGSADTTALVYALSGLMRAK